MFLRQQQELLVPGRAIDPNIHRTTVLSSGEHFSTAVEATVLIQTADSLVGAALALVAWDAVLSLDDEVSYIWS